MMYKVIEDFTDLQDKMYTYTVGMTYPRDGYIPTEKRISELSGTRNKLGRPVIELIPEITVADQPDGLYIDKEASINKEPVEKPRKRRKER